MSYSFENVAANHSIEALFTRSSSSSIAPLNHRVLDAEYSKQLDRIVTVSATPLNQLHIIDPLTGASVAVDLPLAPTCVSVGPDGLFAAVGHNGWISYVNLSTHALIKTLPVTVDVLDIVLAGNGWVYAFPRRDQWTTIRCVDLESGVEVQNGGQYIYAGTLAKLHPSGNAMYGADNGLSPSDIEKYGITPQGQAVLLYDSPYHGDYAMCGNLWISEDGFRIFTKCGNVFRSSEIRAEDMVYNGSLGSIGSVADLSHSTSANKILAIPGNIYGQPANSDTEVWKYDSTYLSFESKIRLPVVFLNGQAYSSHGKFVFFSTDGSRYSVVVQADPSSGMLLDYGIFTLGTNIGQFFIHASATMGGTITPFGAVAVYQGNNQSFTITPSTGYHLTDVVVDSNSVGAVTSYEFIGVTADHTILAYFAADAYNLTVSATGTGSGMITTDPAGITCGAHCSEAFNSGSVVMLIATPAKGSIFAGWIGNVDCSDGQVTMNADKTCTATFTRLSKMADFNGDGKTDIAIYRSSNGTWYVYPSGGNPPFGLRWGGDFSDIPVAGDYDGDGESDIAFYRGNTGAWWIIPSSGVGPRGQVGAYELGWGGTGYKPVPGNYDGDAKTDIAIYETSTGAWWIIPSSGVGPQGQVGAYGIGWGGPAFKPVPGDYDGDGKTDIAIYDTTGGAWWIIPSSGASAYGVGWGGSAFTPVPGDYDGDGKTDMAIYETNTGTWWIIPSSTITPPTPYGVPYGMGWGGDISDVPLSTNPD
jgi:hypothetical protein